MAARGADLVGEARLVDALAPRGAAILDAGCGPGRHAGHLHRAGHRVVGVDLDPVLIAAAEADEPGPTYLVADLADDFALPPEAPQRFDVILCAGNVLGFVHPATRRPILTRLGGLLAPGGRLVTGFGAGRGYDFGSFFADAAAAGLRVAARYSTWDLRPYGANPEFLVAFLER
nr:class I SAM-dependent methyltransferase [Propionibacterium sp.]